MRRSVAVVAGVLLWTLGPDAIADDAGTKLSATDAGTKPPVVTTAKPPAPAPPPAPVKKPPPPSPKPQKPTAKPTPAPRAGQADEGVRHQVAGGPTMQDIANGAESPELRAMRDAEREAFPPASADLGSVWPNELPSPLFPPSDFPVVHATGAPVLPSHPALPTAEGGKDVSWLAALQMPDLPVRLEPRVVRYLELYKNDARARASIGVWIKRSGRYRALVESALQKKGLPRDLFWLSMIESGFDPVIRSPAGAVGMWQFMPETGKAYGLPTDRWVDERMNVELATTAAADFLGDLYRRFSSWDLAMAAYNMGYGGILSQVRKYDTNDFWKLSSLEGSLPWETTLYVPKILAAAVVAHNLKTFGLDGIVPDPPVAFERAGVPFGISLSQIASVAGCSQKELETLNPELRASRTPAKDSDVAGATASDPSYSLRVPPGKAAVLAQNGTKLKTDDLERYVVRFGETLEQIAQARGTTVDKLVSINAIAPGEVVRGGTTLLCPHAPASLPAPLVADKPPAVVPPDIFVYPDRRRIFYKVLVGDTLPAISQALHVPVEDLLKWNDFDLSTRLAEGMTVQAFVPKDADVSKVLLLAESDVRVLPVGSDEFFAFFEGSKGRRRMVVQAKRGDTLESVGKRYGVAASLMERINRRPRGDALAETDSVVVYLPAEKGEKGSSTTKAKVAPAAEGDEPAPLGPLPAAPHPELLPTLP